jgi:hypothetical protein
MSYWSSDVLLLFVWLPAATRRFVVVGECGTHSDGLNNNTIHQRFITEFESEKDTDQFLSDGLITMVGYNLP